MQAPDATAPPTPNPKSPPPVIVCGLGNVGRQIVLRLREASVDVVAIDLAPSPRARHLCEENGVRLIVGDARLPAVLLEAGLATARSIVLATSDDVVNLEVALLADEADTDARVVLRMFNHSIARQLEAQFPRWTVLSLADLAAPTIVAATVSPNVLRGWRIEGQLLALAEVADEEPTVVGEYPEVTPVYLRREGGEIELWPDPEQHVAVGDRLGVIAPVTQLERMRGVLQHGQPDEGSALRRMLGLPARLVQSVRTMVRQTEPILLWIFGAITGAGLLSVGVFALFWDLSLLDSVYFVATVMTTTGFGDIHLRDAPVPIKLYGIGLMVLGAGLLMPSVYAFVTLYIVTARLQHLVGTIRADFGDHVVVVGLGTVGFRVLEGLRQLRPRVIGLDRGDGNELARTVQALGTVVVHGDARRIETLRLANVHRARTIVAATSDDVTNLETALNARRENPNAHVVLRLADHHLAQRVAGAFGLGASFSPAGLAATAFASAALGSSAIEAFRLAEHELTLGQLEVDEQWAGRTVADLGRDAALHPIVLLRVPPVDRRGRSGALLTPPPPDEELRVGDRLVVVAESEVWHARAGASGVAI
jgi:Trk K+ transport system NAD-binding subunit